MSGSDSARIIFAHARRFVSHAGGSMTIPAVIFFVMLMGVGGLAIDLQRLYGVHGDMQSYVDNLALSGAVELDGQSGALTRSFRAVWGDGNGGPLVGGTQNFATGAAALSPQRVTFLSALGTDPGPIAPTPAAGDIVLCTYEGGAWTPANCNTNATNEKNTRFVEVVAVPRTVDYVVLPVADVILQLVGADPIASSATLRLRATAGFKARVCDITPLMVCNPNEPLGNTNTLLPYSPVRGQQILMKGDTSWAPGIYGLVDVPSDAGGTKCNGGGANAIRCMLGLVNPLTHCIEDDVVDVKPGQANSVNQGLNVRFDIYEGNMNNKRTDSDFAPSVNVTKGVCRLNGSNCNYNGGNACSNLNQMSATPTTPANKRTVRLPRDGAFSGPVGNGSWDRNAYWSINHAGQGALPASLANATRYDMYRYEIDNNLIPNKSGTNGENGGKVCSSATGVNNPARDRRTLSMAVVNCAAWGMHGNNSEKLGVKAVAYVQMFLTEPVGLDASGAPSASVNDIYGEIVSVITPNDQTGIYKVYPVLYR